MIKLGYSFGDENTEHHSRIEVLEWLLSLSDEAIELSFVELERTQYPFTAEEFRLIKRFRYISIHAPIVFQDTHFLTYPSEKIQSAIAYIHQLRQQVDVHVVLFHPDIIEDFQWLNQQFGTAIAFENMDAKKQFGTSIQDMNIVFDACPNAHWVCDVNHLFTNDPTLQSSADFHAAFGERLCHYHLSAYNGFHDAFHVNPQDEVFLTAVKNKNVPMIHEGGATRKDFNFLRNENEFVLSALKVIK